MTQLAVCPDVGIGMTAEVGVGTEEGAVIVGFVVVVGHAPHSPLFASRAPLSASVNWL